MLEITVSSDTDRQRFATVGQALADPKRLCVLESLAIGELSVSDLSVRVGCQVPNMSQHLAVLRRAGLVTTRRVGSTVYYRLTDARVLQAYRLIQGIARSDDLGGDAPAEPVRRVPQPAGERIAGR